MIVFDFVDETLDAVPQFVGRLVIGQLFPAKNTGRDNGIALDLNEKGAKVVGVIALVSDEADQRQTVDQRDGLYRLVDLAGSEDKSEWAAGSIDSDVDLGAEAAARAADCLILGPPFAPAACW